MEKTKGCLRACPAAVEAPGSGFTPPAPSRSRAGTGRAACGALHPAEDVALSLPPATCPRLRKKVAPHGAQSGARRAPLPTLACPSAHRSPPRLRPLGLRLPSLGPGSRAPSRPPHSRAPGALGAKFSRRPPRHRCRWAPRREMRRCSLGRRYCEAGQRGRAGVWTNWKEGGTRRAPRLSRREEETATSPELAEARMGSGKRGPPPSARPRPPARRAFSPSSSPGTRRSRVALGLPLHSGPDSTIPCPTRPL